MTIDEFCMKHNACDLGYQWARKHCASMQHAWDTTTRRDWLVWIATRNEVLSKRDLQWIALRCAKLGAHLMPAESRQALSVVECWLLGLASDIELEQARRTPTAAYAAVDAAAYAAVDAVAYAAAAAAYAATAAAYAVAYAAVDAAINKQIMSIIREYKPNFSHTTCS